MMLKDLFLDYLVNYEIATKKIPSASTSESIEIPTNKYSRMVEYTEAKRQNEEEENPTVENEDKTIKWTYSTPSEGSITVSKSWSSPYTDLKKWIADMTAAYERLGLNNNAIRNLIAKNSLESSWGTSALGDYNFGNMTAGKFWTGRIVEGLDKDKDGKPIKQRFRAYDSLDDFVKDEILFLTRLYDFDLNDDLSTFLNKLQGGNKGKRYYAEDPSYKNKVRSRYMKI